MSGTEPGAAPAAVQTAGAMLELSVEVDGEAAEAVCELFERYGGGAVVEVLIRDGQSGRALPERRHRVLTYLPADDVEGRFKVELGLWHLSLLHPIPEAAVRGLAEANWAEAWKAHYRPLRIPAGLGLPGESAPPATPCEGFVILPAWLGEDSLDTAPSPGEQVLRLDPGMAFGTGLHPSTQLCLAALACRLKPGDDVLDLGTGSGILAIAARLLGAGRVLGVDVDPKAVEVAGENAGLNACQVELRAGELGPEGLRPIAPGRLRAQAEAVAEPIGGPFALILANILAPTLTVLAPTLRAYLAPGGLLVLSGILDDQASGVLAAYAAEGLRCIEQRQEGDWVGLTLGMG